MNKTVTFSEIPPLVRQISDQSKARKNNTQTPTERIIAKQKYKKYKEKTKKKHQKKQQKRRQQQQQQQQQQQKEFLTKTIEIDPIAEARETMRIQELNRLYEKSMEARETMRIQELNRLYEKSMEAHSSKTPISSIKLKERPTDSKCIPGQRCSIMGGKIFKRITRRRTKTKTRPRTRTRTRTRIIK